jgi:4-hydroxy-tetrahydrodipicolinate synthase
MLRLRGSIVALVTPMKQDGSIDYIAFNQLIDWHIESGTQGILVLGTTGESPTVTDFEREKLIVQARQKTDGRCPLIVGTGSYSTAHAIELTKQAEILGADAVLVVTPYYNKPTQSGLIAHFSEIAKNTSLPIILYNVPGRTGCDLQPMTVGRLEEIDNIIGIKEATGDLSRVADLRDACGEAFVLLTGDDASALSFMEAGGQGVISVTSNVAPQKMRAMCDAAFKGEFDLAFDINADLMPLHKALFLESNPIPVKYVLSEMGKIEEGIRLPLEPLSAQYRVALRDILDTMAHGMTS